METFDIDNLIRSIDGRRMLMTFLLTMKSKQENTKHFVFEYKNLKEAWKFMKIKLDIITGTRLVYHSEILKFHIHVGRNIYGNGMCNN